jgi:hypothetical protein
MNLSDLEQHVFAYYLANGAADLTMAPRFWPYGDLVLIVEDKIGVATRKFGGKVTRASANVASAFVDLLIEQGGFSVAENRLSKMYRYEGPNYQNCINELRDANPIVRRASAAAPGFWDEAFAALIAG